MDLEQRLGDLRVAREAQGLWRDRTCGNAESHVRWDLRTNDPFDLSQWPAESSPGRRPSLPNLASPVGAAGSRLVSGSHPEHAELEACLARWVGLSEALVFSSAYLANLAVLPALTTEQDIVFSDALNHASIIDGCRLSRARRQVYSHLDLGELAEKLVAAPGSGVRWVVTESYFGMGATGPDLLALRELCDAHGAVLVVDEAHALGVFGQGGAGRCAEAGIEADVLVGGLGKSVGAQGGFVAGNRALRDALWNGARSFVYTTGLSPWLCSRARHNLETLRCLGNQRRSLGSAWVWLDSELRRAGVRLSAGRIGPIFPLVAGEADAAVALASALAARGLGAQAIRPPSVPLGGAVVRFTLKAALVAELESLASAVIGAWREVFDPARPGPQALDTGEPEREPRTDRPNAPEARRWLVLGTGTEVGKTHVCEQLCRALSARGLRVGGLKPIETGLASGEGPSDAHRLAAVAAGVQLPPTHPLFGYEEALTPALTARRSGKPVRGEELRRWLSQAEQASPGATWIVEGAGGAFSPLAEGLTNVELARWLEPEALLLVAADRLGTLHDVLATVRALRAEGYPPDLVILSKPGSDPSVGTNLDELRRQPGMPPTLALGSDALTTLGKWLDLHSPLRRA